MPPVATIGIAPTDYDELPLFHAKADRARYVDQSKHFASGIQSSDQITRWDWAVNINW